MICSAHATPARQRNCANPTTAHEVVCRHRLRTAARRMFRPARPQRRRQDHHAAAVPGPHRARRRRRSPCSACRCRSRRAKRAQRIGVVPQIDNLDPDFTVRENLLVYGRYFGLADAAKSTRASPALLEFAGLASARRRQHPDAVRRHEAAADAGARADQRSRPDFSRRTDHRPRSAGAPPDLGTPAQLHARRARRCSSPRTSWTKPSGCATASPSWTTAA